MIPISRAQNAAAVRFDAPSMAINDDFAQHAKVPGRLAIYATKRSGDMVNIVAGRKRERNRRH
jgi:hypothetical protein